MKNYFGICEWCMPDVGADALYRAHRLGFDGIQITERGGYEAGFPMLTPYIQEEYRRAVGETGIKIQALHLFGLCRLACMVHPVDSSAGKIAQKSVEAAVQTCAALHIPAIMITSGFLCQIKNETDFLIFAEHLRIACQMAGEKGVRVVFESALTVTQIIRMRELVSNALKICYDIFNPIRFHMAHPEEDILKLGAEAIDHFHLKDGPEDMVGCSLLGGGVVGFGDIAKAIRKTGFCGWLVSENYYAAYPLNQQGEFDELAQRDCRTMHHIFS